MNQSLTRWLPRRLTLQCLAMLLALSAATLPVALAREGVNVGGNSAFSKLVSADNVEQSAAQEYASMLKKAAAENALVSSGDRQVRRLRAIADKIIPFANDWNPRARNWRWEVNLIEGKSINAFCMPGGKIVFYTGLLNQLQLNDAEVAMVMGHEIAHALREHARARMGKNAATGIGASLLGQIFGFGDIGRTVTNYGAQLLTLQFSRTDESDADLVGMELAARAGFDPRAGVTLWQKMAAANSGAPPEWLSTHPSGNTRTDDIVSNLPQVMPLYDRARGK
jgi:predicted Zn-dependent protease